MILLLHIVFDFHQIFIDQIDGRKRVQHIRCIFIDSSYTGHQPERCHGKYSQLWYIIYQISLAKGHLHDNGNKQTGDSNCLYQIFGQNGNSPGQPQPSCKFRIIFLIFVNKEGISFQNLDFLNTAQRLIHPLINLSLIYLIVPSQLIAVSSGTRKKGSHEHYQQGNHYDGNGLADKEQVNTKNQTYHQFGCKLHEIEDNLHESSSIFLYGSL